MPFSAHLTTDSNEPVTKAHIGETPEAAIEAAMAEFALTCRGSGAVSESGDWEFSWDSDAEIKAAIQEDLDDGRLTVIAVEIAAPPAVVFATYEDYVAARRGHQVLPRPLWLALKTGDDRYVTRRNTMPATT